MIISFSFRPISQGTLSLSLRLSVFLSRFFDLCYSTSPFSFLIPHLPSLSLLAYSFPRFPVSVRVKRFLSERGERRKRGSLFFSFSCPGICIALSFRCPVRPVSVSNVAVAAEKRRQEQICTAYFREVKLEWHMRFNFFQWQNCIDQKIEAMSVWSVGSVGVNFVRSC